MKDTYKIEIISPEKVVFSDEIINEWKNKDELLKILSV